MHVTKLRKTDIKLSGHCIQIDRYGDHNSKDRKGIIASFIVDDDERLKLYVWSDISQEDPTHIIDLENARESNRSK